MGNAGHLCTTQVRLDACILDLRGDWHEAMYQAWVSLKESDLGKHHYAAKSPNHYLHACKTGLLLKFAAAGTSRPPIYAQVLREEVEAFRTRMGLAMAERYAIKNFLQKWTELAIAPYRKEKFDAVICNESETPEETCTQLFVFNTGILLPPVWLDSALAKPCAG